MLVVDPMKRMTIPEIRQHPWFQARLPRYLAVPPPDTMQQAKKVESLFLLHMYEEICQAIYWTIDCHCSDWWGNSPRSDQDGIWQEPANWISSQQNAKWGLVLLKLCDWSIKTPFVYNNRYGLITYHGFFRLLLLTICYWIIDFVFPMAILELSSKKLWCVWFP